MLSVENLTKSYTLGDRTQVGGVRDVSFDVAQGEFYTLLGPSGCGKTTTLRCVAGLEEPSAGRIALGGAACSTPASAPACRRTSATSAWCSSPMRCGRT